MLGFSDGPWNVVLVMVWGSFKTIGAGGVGTIGVVFYVLKPKVKTNKENELLFPLVPHVHVVIPRHD